MNEEQFIEEILNKEPSIEEIISSGHMLIIDLIGQVDSLSHYKQNRAVLSSSVILSFSILEVYVNFISELLLTEHRREISSPQIINKLSDIELDLVQEKKSIFDYNKLIIKKTNNSYIPILDKIVVISRLLAKTYNIDFNVDKSANDWKYLKQLKEKRDEIAHPKFDSKLIKPIINLSDKTDAMKPSYEINHNDLLNGLIGIRWYLKINGILLVNIYKGKFSSLNLFVIDKIIRDLILRINKNNKNNEIYENLESNIDEIYEFEDSSDEELNKFILALTTR